MWRGSGAVTYCRWHRLINYNDRSIACRQAMNEATFHVCTTYLVFEHKWNTHTHTHILKRPKSRGNQSKQKKRTIRSIIHIQPKRLQARFKVSRGELTTKITFTFSCVARNGGSQCQNVAYDCDHHHLVCVPLAWATERTWLPLARVYAEEIAFVIERHSQCLLSRNRPIQISRILHYYHIECINRYRPMQCSMSM